MAWRSTRIARRVAGPAPVRGILAFPMLAVVIFAAGPAWASIVPSTAPPPSQAAAPPAAAPAAAPVAAPPTAPPSPNSSAATQSPLATPILATPATPSPAAPTPAVSAPAPTPAPTQAPTEANAPPGDVPAPGWTAAPAAPVDAGASPAPPPASAPAGVAPAVAAGPPLLLDQPEVPDTGRLSTPAHSVALSGVTGLGGQFATDLHGAISADGGHVTCQQQQDGDYQCDLPDGTDVAALALRNGAAQTRPTAPDHYLQLENLAREERRGIWASLPPPPVHVEHPTVVDTATLTAAGATYKLDGLIGLGGEYARNLQGYILANGDALTCSPQGGDGEYVCLMPDQTDIAKLALVNGAARVAPDAPDSYRAEQGDALTNHRGFWLHPPADALATASAPPAVTSYALVAGDDGGDDGVRYVGGAPTAVIEGETVFLVFAGAVGWGYWDHYHRWHGAPARYGHHMERFHPGGAGLRGYGRPHGFAAAGPGFHGGAPGGHPTALREPGHVGAGHPPQARFAGASGGFVRPPQMHGAPTFHGGGAPGFHGGGAPAFHGGGAPAFHGGGAPAFHGGGAPAFHGGGAPAFHAAPSHGPQHHR